MGNAVTALPGDGPHRRQSRLPVTSCGDLSRARRRNAVWKQRFDFRRSERHRAYSIADAKGQTILQNQMDCGQQSSGQAVNNCS